MAKSRVGALLLSLGVSTTTAIIMLATEPYLAIAWDEGYTLGREARVRSWFQALYDPARFVARWQPPAQDEELIQWQNKVRPPRRERFDSRTELLSDPQALAWFWPFAREEPHGHPPFYALLGLAGDVLAPSWQDLPRARLGPILLFSLTAGILFEFIRRRWGGWAAGLAAGAWVFQPNLFGHGHYASYDAVLASLWVLAVVAFVMAVNSGDIPKTGAISWVWTLTFGLVLGCAAATKLTGWFLPIPFLVWAGLYRNRRAWVTLGLGVSIAAMVVYLIIPPWWTDPIGGVVRFLLSNLSRGQTIPIKVQFLGTVYLTPRQSLPWYNTLLWTVMVTPVGFLLLAVVGFWSALRHWRREPTELLIAGHWAFLMILRAMPQTPGHDGVRLFLPAFGMLALLGGLGARTLLDRWGRRAKLAIAAALLEGIVSVAVMMPVPLSYFSPVVGGLPGATALGMEPTYYWDAFAPEACHWLTEHTDSDRTIEFASFPRSWLYLRRTGELPRRFHIIDPGLPQWYVLQNRPGAFSDADRALVAKGRAAYTVAKLGVPLIWIFPYSDLERLDPRRRR